MFTVVPNIKMSEEQNSSTPGSGDGDITSLSTELTPVEVGSKNKLATAELAFIINLTFMKGTISLGITLNEPFRESILAMLQDKHPNSRFQIRRGGAAEPRCQSPNDSTIFGFNNYQEFQEFLTKPLTDSLSIIRADNSMWRIENSPYYLSGKFIESNIQCTFE